MQPLEAETLNNKLVAIQRIIVAVDLTEHSEATARFAAEIAKCFGASLYVAHAFAPETLYEFASEGTYTLVEDQGKDLRARLAALVEQMKGIVPTCESVFLEGEPAEEISGFARNVDADLIVTASRHTSFLGRLLNLEQAPKIMHRSPCPVLVYHEKNA